MVSERRQEALNVRVDANLYRTLKLLSAASGRRLRDVAEEALEQWVDAQTLTVKVQERN